MKEILKWSAFALLLALCTACNKDDDNDGEVKLNPTAVFLDWGESATVSYSGVNITEYSLGSYPEGWPAPVLNTAARTLTVTAPAKSEGIATTGSVRLNGITKGKERIGASLYVALAVAKTDYTAQPANSYLATKPNTQYSFDATLKGDGKSTINTERVAIVWQSSRNLIQYLNYEHGVASFYIAKHADDETKVTAGNAVIGAYDAADNLLWSWHIWVVNYDPEAEALNYGDYTVMSRPLGALENKTDSQVSTLNSYGLYYQWGRKDPFPGPSSYNASKGYLATIFDADYNTVPVQRVSAEEGGSYDYANAHPTHFITTTGKHEDWCRTITNEVKGWSATTKTVNDPCPYGWQVAPAAAFAGLSIVDDLSKEGSTYAEQYGWTLTDGITESFYFAGGRYVYLNGLIQNVYDDELTRNSATEAQPWVGYNWTADGKAFTYWLKKDEVSKSGLRTDFNLGRANGASVRCVRVK